MHLHDLYTSDSHEAGAEINIIGPDGKATNLWIMVKGVDSKSYRDDQRANRRVMMDALATGTIEDIDEDKRDTDTLVKLTIGWRGTDEKYSKKLCKKLYTKAPHVRDQVDRFIGTRANFIKG